MLAIFIVDNVGDGIVTGPGDQPGTLRQAVFDANFISTGADEIVFDPAVFNIPREIFLTEGELNITESLTIIGIMPRLGLCRVPSFVSDFPGPLFLLVGIIRAIRGRQVVYHPVGNDPV